MILESTTAPIKPIGRVSTVQAVADDVRNRVLDGEFAPGSQLREADLVGEYQVARHCIRSALHQLAHEGLLRHHPNRGVFLPDTELEVVRDVLIARAAIETEALRLVTTERRPVAGIVHAMEQLDALPDDVSWSDLLRHDHEVHRAIVIASGSERLCQLHDGLLAESQLHLAFFKNKDEQRRLIRPSHRQLITALLDHDTELACRLLRRDLGEAIGVETL